jgi:hypothetical protein
VAPVAGPDRPAAVDGDPIGATASVRGGAPREVARDQVATRTPATSPLAIAVALERARAGLARLAPDEILAALDPVWHVDDTPPSAWYLRAAALSLRAQPIEAEGIALLGRERWPREVGLQLAHALAALGRAPTDETAAVIDALPEPWRARLSALAAPRSAPTGAPGTVRPTRAPSPMVRRLVDALLAAPSDDLAREAMALARGTAWGADAPAERLAQRRLVAAVFAVLSREGGVAEAGPPDEGAPALETVVARLRAGDPAGAATVAARLAGTPMGEVAAQLLAAAHDGASSPSTDEVVALPDARALWREGLSLLAPPEVDAARHAPSGSAPHGTGWTPWPAVPPTRRGPAMLRWSPLVLGAAALAALSRCVWP